MKYTKYFALFISMLMTAACSLKMETVRLAPESAFKAPTISAMGSVISDANTAGVEEVVFNWESADFGAPTQVTYSVFVALGDRQALVGQTNYNSLSISKGDLVAILVSDLGAAKNQDVTVNSFVTARVAGENTAEIKSGSTSYSVFTYLAAKRSIFLPGNYQGWSATATDLWETDGGSNIYKMLVDVDGGKGEAICYFKLHVDGSWQGFNDGWKAEWDMPDQTQSDGNFNVPIDEKYIRLTVNVKKKTLNREVISYVGLIGDHNGWADNENAFTYDPAQNVWEAEAAFEAGKGFLIRLNQDWNMKFGGGTSPSDEVPGGFVLEESGGAANIPTPGTGNYKVVLHANRTPWVITFTKL
ncbi:MAG: SusE domain-containing protein [Bacteroidales bacterium]|nr:SusE domain-containing protein [Bacteroidales bacterium]